MNVFSGPLLSISKANALYGLACHYKKITMGLVKLVQQMEHGSRSFIHFFAFLCLCLSQLVKHPVQSKVTFVCCDFSARDITTIEGKYFVFVS